MKKGIVMEKHQRFLIVLTKDGQFIRTKGRKDVELGEEISFIPARPSKVMSLYSHKMFSVPFAAAFIMLLFIPMLSFFTPERVYGVVAVDINPSVELSIDRRYVVIDTKGYNSAGTELLDQVNDELIGRSLSHGVELLMEKGSELGFLKQEQEVFISSYLMLDEYSWGNNYDQWVDAMNDKFSVNLITLNVDDAVIDSAQKVSLSPVKYLLYNDALERGFSLELESVQNKSVNDIERNTGANLESIVPAEKIKTSDKPEETEQLKEQKILEKQGSNKQQSEDRQNKQQNDQIDPPPEKNGNESPSEKPVNQNDNSSSNRSNNSGRSEEKKQTNEKKAGDSSSRKSEGSTKGNSEQVNNQFNDKNQKTNNGQQRNSMKQEKDNRPSENNKQ
ncbi:Anti-sigma factor N-terminus [Evansella caseinilytica]|uniref:Anti-sigma factor N-terminus n=1 Tax=Evansella caseinilytica TaxID=1503961 RepID=A0A1H3NK75_9BACI|nr:anti-sigma factor domain-containing protein [Evansella caseinilytica]SDY89194.1 Anti-sigma factor N-terminus [Evansella caseinilytica]